MKKRPTIEKISHSCHKAVLKIVRLSLQKGCVTINSERCKGCELCINECPANTLELSVNVNTNGFRFSQQTKEHKCIGCAACALICPDGCITVYRKSSIRRKKSNNDTK